MRMPSRLDRKSGGHYIKCRFLVRSIDTQNLSLKGKEFIIVHIARILRVGA